MTTTTTEPPTESVALEIIPPDVALAPETRVTIESAFTPFFSKARELVAQAATVTSPKIARAVRLELKNVRTAAEKQRKALQEDARLYVNAVNGANNILLAAIVPAEKRMDDIEKAEEQRIAQEIEARAAQRRELLAPYGLAAFAGAGVNLGTISEDDFQALLADSKGLHDARVERERVENERILAQQVAEAKERERIRLDNERLLREAQEREEAARVEREKAEADRKALEAKHAQERAESERKAEYERQQAQAQADAAAEKARKEREALEAKAKAEKAKADAKTKAIEEALRIEREAREKERQAAEAADFARKEDEARKVREAEEAAERAAQAPDKQKILAFCDAIAAIPAPVAKSKKAQKLVNGIVADIQDAAETLRQQAEKL